MHDHVCTKGRVPGNDLRKGIHPSLSPPMLHSLVSTFMDFVRNCLSAPWGSGRICTLLAGSLMA